LKREVFFGRKDGFSIPEYLNSGRIHPFFHSGGHIGTRAAMTRLRVAAREVSTVLETLFSAKREKT
jgi:hypothetical protein